MIRTEGQTTKSKYKHLVVILVCNTFLNDGLVDCNTDAKRVKLSTLLIYKHWWTLCLCGIVIFHCS